MNKKIFYLVIISISLFYTDLTIASLPTLPDQSLEHIIETYGLKPTYELTPENIINELSALYLSAASEAYIGEAISQLEHALQTAQQALYGFNKEKGLNEENIIASLLHDIGHRITGTHVEQMNEFGVKHHDEIGAAFLQARGFSSKVVELVRGHVNAKRYNVFKNQSYHAQLTYASQQTLIWQGGAMTQEEATLFEKNNYFQQILLLRNWEEKAKVPGAQTPSFSYFMTMILNHLSNQ